MLLSLFKQRINSIAIPNKSNISNNSLIICHIVIVTWINFAADSIKGILLSVSSDANSTSNNIWLAFIFLQS